MTVVKTTFHWHAHAVGDLCFTTDGQCGSEICSTVSDISEVFLKCCIHNVHTYSYPKVLISTVFMCSCVHNVFCM